MAIVSSVSIKREDVPVSLLQPHPKNYRKHPEAQILKLRASLRRYGQVKPIVVQTAGKRYTIVAGHGIVTAAKAEEFATLNAVIFPAGMDETEIRGYLLADNMGGADDDQLLLAELLREQREMDRDLLSAGYDAGELDELLARLHANEHPLEDPAGGGDDYDPTPPREQIARAGDIWQLGNHRLLCGDSTLLEPVERLLEGEAIDLVWTDPPYGVDYVGGSQDARSYRYRKGRPVPGDDRPKEQIFATLRGALSNAESYANPGCVAYVASPSGDNLASFITAMTASGFTFHHGLVWAKDSFVFGRTDYHYQHEMILYGWTDGAHYWAGDHTLGTVFTIPRPKRSKEHPTMKPVELVGAMIANSSRGGQLVYDPFCGSGSTLIACERLGRRCYAVELDPRNCDVILSRYEAETGAKPTLLSRVEAEVA